MILDFVYIYIETEEDLQKAIQIFDEVCTWFGLTLSVKKTEFMIQRAILNYK